MRFVNPFEYPDNIGQLGENCRYLADSLGDGRHTATLAGAEIGNIISGNFTYFNTHGTMLMTGSAVTWNDIVVGGASMGAGATAPDLELLGSSTIRVRTFDGTATTEQLYDTKEMLHDYQEGTTIYPHVHWCPTTANSGTVVWQLEYSWANNGSNMSNSVTLTQTATAPEVAWMNMLTEFSGGIAGTGKNIGSIFAYRLFRDPGEDTYAHDAALTDFGIHYQQNSVGSIAKTSK